MREKQEYVVQVVVTTAHEYILTARTEEEAISTAEGLYEDGDKGKVLDSTFEEGEAYPYTDAEDGEDED